MYGRSSPDRSWKTTDWTAKLLQMSRELKLTEDPRFAQVLQRVIVSGKQEMAEKLVRGLEPRYARQLVEPDQFITNGQLGTGEILLGHSAQQEVRVSGRDLSMHVLVAGRSGSGKTTFLRHLFEQLRRDTHVVFLDRKLDMPHTARKGVLVIPWQELRLNPLCPPHPALPLEHWLNDFCTLFSELYQFWTRGGSVFLRGSHKVCENPKRRTPTLHDLLALFKAPSFASTVHGRGKESLRSIVDKLEALLTETGKVFNCRQGFPLQRLFEEKEAVSISLDGLGVASQNLLLLILWLNYYHLFKTLNLRDRLNVVLFFDEAKSLFGQHVKSFTLFDLIAKSREYGVGLVAADQSPSLLSQYLWSNAATVVSFGVSDGNDLRRLRYSLGATFQQAQELLALKPGEAAVRSPQCKDLIKLKVPYKPVDKSITHEELQRLGQARLDELRKHVIAAEKTAPERVELGELERRLLTLLAEGGLEWPCSKVYRHLGVSPSQGHRLKTWLKQEGYISQVRTTLGGKGRRAHLLVPNPEALEALGITPPEGKGKLLHKHVQGRLAQIAEKLGWTVTIEENPAGGKEGVDVGLKKGGCRVAVEVCVTSKAVTEAGNIAKALRLGYDHVILTFVHSRVLEKARQIAQSKYKAKTLERVSFCMIHELETALREVA